MRGLARFALAPLALALVLAISTPWWLPLPGTLLVDVGEATASDVALVLDGAGRDAKDGAEAWRKRGIVGEVVIVEAPVRTHALVTYWTDLVQWGLAEPSITPAPHLKVVRASAQGPGEQAQAALPALRAYAARSVLVPAGGLGSRLTRQELLRVLGPEGITVRLASLGPPARDPARWYEHAEDRRFVLGQWLQFALPFARGDDSPTGS